MSEGNQVMANEKLVRIPKSQLFALIGSFIVTFLGSWVQLNQRIGKMETQIHHLETVVRNVGTMDKNIAIIVEQNKWMQKEISDQRQEIKQIRKSQLKP